MKKGVALTALSFFLWGMTMDSSHEWIPGLFMVIGIYAGGLTMSAISQLQTQNERLEEWRTNEKSKTN